MYATIGVAMESSIYGLLEIFYVVKVGSKILIGNAAGRKLLVEFRGPEGSGTARKLS